MMTNNNLKSGITQPTAKLEQTCQIITWHEVTVLIQSHCSATQWDLVSQWCQGLEATHKLRYNFQLPLPPLHGSASTTSSQAYAKGIARRESERRPLGAKPQTFTTYCKDMICTSRFQALQPMILCVTCVLSGFLYLSHFDQLQFQGYGMQGTGATQPTSGHFPNGSMPGSVRKADSFSILLNLDILFCRISKYKYFSYSVILSGWCQFLVFKTISRYKMN